MNQDHLNRLKTIQSRLFYEESSKFQYDPEVEKLVKEDTPYLYFLVKDLLIDLAKKTDRKDEEFKSLKKVNKLNKEMVEVLEYCLESFDDVAKIINGKVPGKGLFDALDKTVESHKILADVIKKIKKV